MYEELLHARHLAELGLLEQHLEEGGYPTQLLEKSATFPMNVLLAGLKPSRNEQDRLLQLSFIPLAEDELQHVQLLQLYTTIVAPRDSSSMPGHSLELVALLNAINCRLAIGQFAVKDDGEIHYRHVHCPSTGSGELDNAEPFLEIVSLFVFMLDMFAEIITDTADGRLTLNQALAALA